MTASTSAPSAAPVSPVALSLAPDLSRRAPRSPRCRLGGYVHLPRLLDKTRAHIAGTPGEYHFNCPIDRQFFDFTGVDAEAFRAAAAEGRSDGEMLEWVRGHARHVRAEWEIEAWAAHQERRQPASDSDTLAFFAGLLGELSKTRTDIRSWFDLLDLDDHVSFGGSA